MSDVKSAGPRPIPRPRPSDPAADRRLARVHLGMGLLGLARAELEALAGAGDLDDQGLVSLAEARWRTGDLAGAGEAAQAHLGIGGTSLIALVIAAEATASVGRPGEARRLAAHAVERANGSLDTVFAGMPRSLIWPADAADAEQPAGTLFPDDGLALRRGAVVTVQADEAPDTPFHPPADRGFWDTEETGAHGGLPSPNAALDAAEAALEQGDLSTAAVHLAIVLRVGPGLAPAVLETAGRAAGPAPELDLVRGDAYRLLGHERDAQHAYTAAAAALTARAERRARNQEEQ